MFKYIPRINAFHFVKDDGEEEYTKQFATLSFVPKK